MSTVLTCVAQGAAPRRFTRHPEPSRRVYTSSRTSRSVFTRHPEQAAAFLHVIPNKPQRFYTSSRTKPKGLHVIPNKPKGLHVIPNKPKARVRDPPVCCNPSLARGFLASDGMTESTSPLKLLAQAKPYFCVAWSDLTTLPPRCARHPPLHREGKIRGL